MKLNVKMHGMQTPPESTKSYLNRNWLQTDGRPRDHGQGSFIKVLNINSSQIDHHRKLFIHILKETEQK